jgi:uncharacterized protein YjbJ (UPF0337 family)
VTSSSWAEAEKQRCDFTEVPETALRGKFSKEKRRNQMKPSTKDQIKGELHELKGNVKETAGQVTNNANLETKGRNEKLAGKVQKKVGQIEKVIEK